MDRFNHPLRPTGGTGEGTGYRPSHCRDTTHLLLSLFPFIPGAASSKESFQHINTMHPLTNQVLEAFFDLVIQQILVTALTLGIFAAQKVTWLLTTASYQINTLHLYHCFQEVEKLYDRAGDRCGDTRGLFWSFILCSPVMSPERRRMDMPCHTYLHGHRTALTVSLGGNKTISGPLIVWLC